MTLDDATLAKESADLLVDLIRNECVNDGSAESGFESRSADLLAQYLGDTGLELERYAARPGRENLVARIEGSDPNAPTLLLMGHTDVVPVNPDGWRRDPFGGEIVDGEVWGRGAVDMLNLTATMAVAFRDLARSGFKPRGTLVYLAVADEENLGTWGADHMLKRERDAVAADYVVTEAGGFQLPSSEGPRLPVIVGEKGIAHANVRAAALFVSGQVTGNLVATQRLEMRSTARVFGHIEAPVVVIEEGALFEGHCQMTPKEKPAAAPGQRDLSVVAVKR